MFGIKHPESQRSSLDGAVCVIEEDQGVRGSLQALLGTLPVKVLAFETAEEFLAALNGGIPSILILELGPYETAGFDLLRLLRSRGISIPALGLTEEKSEELEEEASGLGVIELLEKPFVFWAVIQRVQERMGLGAR
jgi:FixJ family two-component response regulator